MNVEQAGSLARTVVQMILAYAVARGWLGETMAAQVGPATVTLLLAGYGAYLRRDAGPVAVLASFARSTVQAGVAFVVGVGWLDEGTAAQLGAGLTALGVTLYGVYVRRNAAPAAPADTAAAKAG
ncbi:hypothetical protein [Methylobacterium aquaticum]|uniref:Holin n=1 Tax=Methylobacterium aquaticum TaxID=270351 RepID=A0A0C6FTH8_9HYPH|nr:hypothetical protein [Methylobacterium aquaticum]BAQ50402.1 hypothetical protein Maq22A_4p60245 [Methylobacterium aquaticum]